MPRKAHAQGVRLRDAARPRWLGGQTHRCRGLSHRSSSTQWSRRSCRGRRSRRTGRCPCRRGGCRGSRPSRLSDGQRHVAVCAPQKAACRPLIFTAFRRAGQLFEEAHLRKISDTRFHVSRDHPTHTAPAIRFPADARVTISEQNKTLAKTPSTRQEHY